jgi:hypothetical protein
MEADAKAEYEDQLREATEFDRRFANPDPC